MFKALIADDEKLSREAVKLQLKNMTEVVTFAESSDGKETLDKIRELRPDIIFLDIQMPFLNGLEALEQMPKDYSPAVIIISAFDSYALQAFENAAIDYLVKPFTDERFKKAVEKALRVCKSSASNNNDRTAFTGLKEIIKSLFADQETATISIKDGPKISLLKLNEITHFEATENYVTVFTTGKKFLHKETIHSLEQNLPSYFVRIHKSSIVNTSYISEFHSLFNGDYLIRLKTGKDLRMSRNYRQNVQHLLR
jgi:two-component system, LytTR family, response regulator